MGVNVYKHYCGELLEGISLFVQFNPCADEGGEDACSAGKEDSCCADETEFYQLDVKLLKQQQTEKITPKQMISLKLFVHADIKLDRNNQVSIILRDESPPKWKEPLYRQFRQLIFYG